MLENVKQKSLEKKEKQILIILFMPIMFLLGIVPLIVRLKEVQASQIVHEVFREQQFIDFYSQYKAVFILASSIVMMLILFLLFDKYKLKKDKKITMYIIITAIFIAFTVLSTLFSDYKDIAMWGVPDRAEGMVIIFCYTIMMLYTLYAFQNAECYKYIIYSLGLLVIISTIIGISQYMGMDLLVSNIGKQLIIPNEFAEIRERLMTNIQKARVTATMYNPNYIGSFTAMMIPLFMTLAFFVKGKIEKIFLSIIALSSLSLLFGSGSRAGILGTIGAIILLGVIFLKKAWSKKRLIFPILIGILTIVVGLGIATKGIMLYKTTSLLADSLQIFKPVNNDVDYRDYLPIRDLIISEGKLIIITQEEKLTLESTPEGISFTDKKENEVEYQLEKNIYFTQDSRFIDLKFEAFFKADDTSKLSGIGLVYKNRGLFAFQITDQEGIYLVDSFTQQKTEIDFPETLGFKGKEKIGSSRGYLWSRSLPMIKNTFFIGHGPDTYVLEFPQQDYLGKYYALGDPNKVVDKPHNLYLQMAINQGGIALASFISLMLIYIINSFKMYALKVYYKKEEIIGIATLASIVGYLIAGVFNDSVVSVAPIFWILLGMGIAINYINVHDKVEV
ncbi:O-antigen ligase family protein [Cellulosilyticum sp. I15G10I2]|uniref:O-antigen ligase family protein n=1 Tax=Cellulosilyticum sp. I15G10I2 TaxID=1892843 RepID=UPI0009F47752|nr:O-antigen ligase family protein [Cellulosilyticum sp. I15G10I2]